MLYQLLYTKKALDDLKKFPKFVSKHILNKIEFFAQQKNPLEFAKKLIDPKYGTHRFRIGDYRVVFDIDDKGNIKILLILTIKHRKDVYRDI